MQRVSGIFLLMGISLGWGLRGETAEKIADYDPLSLNQNSVIEVLELEVAYGRDDRVVPLRIYLPEGPGPRPTILFSHGLGGSNRGSRYLGEHWAGRGYMAVFLQHPGSDETIWRDRAPRDRIAALNEAANGRNMRARFRDVPAVLDALESWNGEQTHLLFDRMDLCRVGMAGHSFGAVTTQGVSGMQQRGLARFTDDRIKAALVLSPSTPQWSKADEAVGAVGIPWMLMTGTHDLSGVGSQDMASRLAVYPALPPGDKYELVLDGGEHHAFTDGDKRSRNPNHHPLILALSTAFWDAYLKNDDAALAWLQGHGVRAKLGPGDRWQMK